MFVLALLTNVGSQQVRLSALYSPVWFVEIRLLSAQAWTVWVWPRHLASGLRWLRAAWLDGSRTAREHNHISELKFPRCYRRPEQRRLIAPWASANLDAFPPSILMAWRKRDAASATKSAHDGHVVWDIFMQCQDFSVWLPAQLPGCLFLTFPTVCLSISLSVSVFYCLAVMVVTQTHCWCGISPSWRLCTPYINHQPPS